jgi:plastocyanin
MRKITMGLLGLMLLCAFALAACGESSATATPTDTPAPAAPTATTAPAATATTGVAAAATINMGGFSFANTSVTIKAGQAVNFNDPSDTGGSHVLVTGTNGQFTAAPGAPSQFATSVGFNFAPGDSMTITFPTAGTFSITCKIHPSMHATVTVK